MTSTVSLVGPELLSSRTEAFTRTPAATRWRRELIPRMHQWVNQNYPGTMLAITEYSWGALESITGAIAQADILGIFGREALDLGTLWGTPEPTQPGAFAFQIFLNYDGNGSQFGDTSVSATTGDPDTLSIFAAQRADSALTVLVLNKTTGAIADTVSLANFTPAGTAQVWQYSQSNLSAIVRQSPDINVGGNNIAAAFPAYSMTLFVIPQAQSAMSVPQPVVVGGHRAPLRTMPPACRPERSWTSGGNRSDRLPRRARNSMPMACGAPPLAASKFFSMAIRRRYTTGRPLN